MPRGRQPLPLRQAVALGLLQGPAELLPVSSSGHTSLIPWLAGWRYRELEPEGRKDFEVALHAGSALALALDMRGEVAAAARHPLRLQNAVIALALAPPALAGGLLRATIAGRLGGPRSIAAGLLAGGLAMALADRGPAAEGRAREQARPADGLALGAAQALALIPGVSRTGATLAAARARGFSRAGAQALSWLTALPVILGAGALQGRRLMRAGSPGGASREALAAGAGAAFLSTLTSARLLGTVRGRGRALWPYALYRAALALAVLRRLRRAHNGSG